MTPEEARHRLLTLFDEDGQLRAEVVEEDELLSQNRRSAILAAHQLADEEPGMVKGKETDGRGWFPYSFLIRPKTGAA